MGNTFNVAVAPLQEEPVNSLDNVAVAPLQEEPVNVSMPTNLELAKEIVKMIEKNIKKMNKLYKNSDPWDAGWIENECGFFNEYFLDDYDKNEFSNLCIKGCINLLSTKSQNYLLELKKFIINGGTASNEHWDIVNLKRAV